MDLAAAPTHVRDQSTRGRSMDNTSAALLAGVLVVQVAHALTFLAFREPLLASNLLQECTPLLCAALCLHKGKAVRTRRQGRLWMQLSGVYFSWAAAQLFYLATVFIHNTPDMHAISDALWLAFALPILLVTAAPSASLRGDPVALLDTAQACLLFGLLFVLVYPRPGIIKPPLAYDVENLAVLFAAGLRYSVSPSGDERAFYRNIIAFMGVYTLCSLFAYQARVYGLEPGTAIDLCWSLPFTAFCVMAVAGQRVRPRMEQWAGRRLALPAHLHGISAVGMVVMSLAGSVVLSHYSVKAGILTLTASFLVFAGRTSVREWQLHSAHSQLSHSAFHDPLTGLGNRAMLREELSKRLENLQPGAERLTGLLFIDLDRFKTINDGFGHAFGDLLLVRVAALLSSVTRPQDLVARHGGDEFVVLLDQVDEEEAKRLAQLIADSIRNPLELEGRVVHVTASIGIALSSSGSTADAMLQDADCAMYKAKSLGKDRAQFFAPDMLSAVKRQVDLETDLREALASRAIEVHYQPIYALPDNKLQGFEALARWCHPRKGMVSPGRFIPVAEETGLIIELGKQVLRRACQDCQRWNQHFGTRLTVAVNVSALQFAHRGLTDEIEEALNDAQLDPHLLKLEITESVLLSSYQAVEKVLTRARSLGIGVCLDDFGTGYSSLSYLLSFPFDVVKIDRSFVRHLDRDHHRAEMVRMVVQLALTLKKKVIAEGVETQEELAQLSAFGCDMVQGFLFSLPLPLAAVEALLSVEARTADGGRTPLQTEPAPAALASQAPEVSQVAGKMSLMASSLTAGL